MTIITKNELVLIDEKSSINLFLGGIDCLVSCGYVAVDFGLRGCKVFGAKSAR